MNAAFWVLLLTVIVLASYIYYRPVEVVVERPVVVQDVNWIPWSMGEGGWGWPGSFYVNRPMPNFYRSERVPTPRGKRYGQGVGDGRESSPGSLPDVGGGASPGPLPDIGGSAGPGSLPDVGGSAGPGPLPDVGRGTGPRPESRENGSTNLV